MLPPFDLQGGAALAAARDALVTPLLSAFGTVAFRALVAPKVLPEMTPEEQRVVTRRLLGVAQLSVAAALLGAGFWLVMQAATLADADGVGAAFAAVPTVLTGTMFGHVLALQMAALVLLALALSWRGDRVALGVAAVAVALQAGHSHAFSMQDGPSLLLVCDIVHLFGAGAWLGGLNPLLLIVRMAPPRIGAAAARWFSPLGQACLWALLISAAVQGWILVASIPGLIGTAYGWLVLVKLALFGVLFGFAWCNRYRFAPALLHDLPQARRVLVRSIALQTGFAIAILVAAVVLSQLPPAMHTQALWPFAQRFSLAAIQEDPDFRREVLAAALALGLAAAIILATLILRRGRVAALGVALVIGWFAVPHLDLLLVTAYPTSYYHSPTGFTAASIMTGGDNFAANCVMCHGAGGHGDGPAAKSLALPPADLTAAHLWMHSDGELFWWISHGMFSPEGAQVMPGFAGTLDDDTIWNVIDYIRAHNAGTAYHDSGAWPVVVQAPGFGVQCGGTSQALADLRGHFVRLAIGRVPPALDGGVTTIVASPPDGAAVPAAMCVARDETVAAAYAVVTGLAPAAMPGMQFLIDAQGRLRAMQAGAGWDDPARLAAEIAMLRTAHIAPGAGAGGTMPMNMKM